MSASYEKVTTSPLDGVEVSMLLKGTENICPLGLEMQYINDHPISHHSHPISSLLASYPLFLPIYISSASPPSFIQFDLDGINRSPYDETFLITTECLISVREEGRGEKSRGRKEVKEGEKWSGSYTLSLSSSLVLPLL